MPNHPEKETDNLVVNEDDVGKRLRQLVAGGTAGAITKTATAPLERAKIVLQVQGIKHAKSCTKIPEARLRYHGLVGTLLTVVREEGFLALYRGNGANVLRVVPVYALKFTFNDFFRDICKKDKCDIHEKLDFSRLIMSGTLAGLFQTCITYPLETVRTRLSMGKQLGASYDGIFDTIRKTRKTEGIRGFYKGLGPTLLTGSPYVGLQMSGFEILSRNRTYITTHMGLSHESVFMTFFENFYLLFCGALAGITAQTITYPGDTVRRRMQTNGMLGQAKVYNNSIECFQKILKLEGFNKLYAGLSANLVRAIPGAAIQFWAYDNMKKLLGVK